MSESYRDDVLHFSLYTRIVADHVFDLLGALPPGGKLLDIGCGTGYFLARLHETRPKNWELHGLEYDEQAVQFANRRVPGAVRPGSMTNIEYPDGTFDLVLSLSVLEHVEDDDKALDEAARVLKPGGRLIISVPCLNGRRSQSRLRNLGHEDPRSPEYHFRRGYRSEDLLARLRRRGFVAQGRRYGMFLFSELVMDMVKWVYFRTSNALESQTNIDASKSSVTFRIYKALFPGLYALERLERRVCSTSERGHIFTVSLAKS